jgi:hypothetical protein
MIRIAIGILLCAFLAACVGRQGIAASPYAETSAICDNASLDSRLVKLKDGSKDLGGGVLFGNTNLGVGVTGQYGSLDYERQYALADKLKEFDAEVDAKHQSVVSTCKMHARCMEKNGYNETRCQLTLMRWQAADSDFSALARDLRELQSYAY